jgi:hypothetical protein
MPKPLIEKLQERCLGRLQVPAALQFGNQPRALDLCLALGPAK